MARRAQPVLGALCAVWVTVAAISVETPQEVLRAARGRSVTLPCTYRTSIADREGFIQWDKLLKSHTERVVLSKFSSPSYIYGVRYQNRVNFSGDTEHSDASITISQLVMDDNGTYECSVSLLQDLEGTSKGRVRLLVLVPPSKPDCGIQGETVIGHDIQLTCQSREGSPAPQYSWKSFDLLNQERGGPPGTGQVLTLKNISMDTSGFYICTSSNEVGTEFCNITVTVRPPSMNVALYAGIAGGVVAALIIIGVLIYCFSCRDRGKDGQSSRSKSRYEGPKEQQRDIFQGRREEDGS
ncbi:cell surface A33 antigen [Pteronotus mesoamericanus]|uniref:cell surface A33 antigen n=1 Tax=Pteronotus mesoamericanus TaxID=1884717 RepID=UPI0023EAC4D9|nr:cell surface A33 antigen [Pteronotus parnellii mesoamericanus]